jgi:hypothetical protein
MNNGIDYFVIGSTFGFCSALFLFVKAQNKNYPEEVDIQNRLDTFRDSYIANPSANAEAMSEAFQSLEADIKKLYFQCS